MTRHLALLALACVVGCQTARPVPSAAAPAEAAPAEPRFRVESKLEPGYGPFAFTFTTRVHELRDGKWETTEIPRLTIFNGQTGWVMITGERAIRVDVFAVRDDVKTTGIVKVAVTEHERPLYASEQQFNCATSVH
jgi:hypothetical protein